MKEPQSIIVSCPGCMRQFRVKPELAGKRARCPTPGCQSVLDIPELEGMKDLGDGLERSTAPQPPPPTTAPQDPVPNEQPPAVGTPDVGREQRGTVDRYIEDRGYGFIRVEGTAADAPLLFFHVNKCTCSRPYAGELVTFEPHHGKDGRLEAQRVHRAGGESVTGDIVHWEVDPATRGGKGVIAPHDGGGPLQFSWEDLARARGSGARRPNPRPWHAARYCHIPLVAGGARAVDIDVDLRYPLQRFAYLGDEEALIRELKKATLHEYSDYRTVKSKKPLQILYNYLHFTFAKLVDEDRTTPPKDRKIRTRTDLKDHVPLATSNTGLVDRRYESVYALFERNERDRPEWKFLAFCTAGEDAGKLLSRYFNPLPGPARYFSHASELLFDPDAPLHLDYPHILSENRDRLPGELVRRVEKLDPLDAERELKMHIDRATELARKRVRWNFKTAIPHYFPTLKRLDFLLPLCLISDSTVDVALAVERTETGYIGHTILPLDWAYKSARLVCRPDSDWLAPANIDAGDESSSE